MSLRFVCVRSHNKPDFGESQWGKVHCRYGHFVSVTAVCFAVKVPESQSAWCTRGELEAGCFLIKGFWMWLVGVMSRMLKWSF